jgi:hypothetical protein
MRKLLYLIVVGVICSLSYESHAQLNRKTIKKNNRRIGNYKGKKSHFGKDKVYNALGFSLNALNYYGDLAPRPDKVSTDISFTKPALGLSFSHRFGPRYTIVGSFMYGTLKGSDSESADETDVESGLARYKRNLSFRNRIKELSVVAQLDLFQNMATYISRVKWTPYAFAGITVLHHNPKAQAPDLLLDGSPNPKAGEWVALAPLGTEGQHANLRETDVNHGIKPYKLIQPAIPFGLGLRFRVNEVIDIAGEFGFRYLFTDYIDDVSQNYIDLGLFGTDELAKAMSYRSNELLEFTDQQQAEVSTVDGRTYYLLPGYGKEFKGATEGDKGNLRGNKNDKDVYMVTTVRVTYIVGKTFHRAKFR